MVTGERRRSGETGRDEFGVGGPRAGLLVSRRRGGGQARRVGARVALGRGDARREVSMTKIFAKLLHINLAAHI